MATETKNDEDETAKTDLENSILFNQSIETLDDEYEREKSAFKITDAQSLITFQNNFWSDYKVRKIGKTTDEFVQSYTASHSDDFESGNYDKLEHIIREIDILITLYDHEINDKEWPRSDLESRKLTILIGIADIQDYQQQILAKFIDQMDETNSSSGSDDSSSDTSDEDTNEIV